MRPWSVTLAACGGKGRTHRLSELRFTPTRGPAPGLRLETVWEARPLAVTGHNSPMSWTGWVQPGPGRGKPEQPSFSDQDQQWCNTPITAPFGSFWAVRFLNHNLFVYRVGDSPPACQVGRSCQSAELTFRMTLRCPLLASAFLFSCLLQALEKWQLGDREFGANDSLLSTMRVHITEGCVKGAHLFIH